MVLYRSVSIPELSDIWARGVIVGGGNWFNAADDRPYVFFADELDDRLIRQGECLERQAWHAVRHDPLRLRLDAINIAIQQQADLILARMKRDGIPYDAADAWAFQQGWDRRPVRSAVFRCRRAHHWRYLDPFRMLGQMVRARSDIERRLDVSWQAKFDEVKEVVAVLPWSSAIIVTQPISGGLLYSMEFGFSGLGEREYGFAPGAVTLGDISNVVFVKDNEQVARVRSDEVGTMLSRLPRLWDIHPLQSVPEAAKETGAAWADAWADLALVAPQFCLRALRWLSEDRARTA